MVHVKVFFPLLWRYFFKNFFRLFSLIIVAFIFMLLLMRTQEIARFASLGSSLKTIFLFTLYQIPYILSFAIPISALIAAFLFVRRLSSDQEITAFRVMGIPFRELLTPFIVMGSLLTLCNFMMICQVMPYTRMLSKELIYASSTINPLILLQKDKLLKIKDFYTELKTIEKGKHAKQLLFVTPSGSQNRLILITADQLHLEKDTLNVKNFSMISSMDTGNVDGFDHLMIENDEKVIFQRNAFSHLIEPHPWALNHEYLPLKYLLLKLKNKNFSSVNAQKRTETEIIRRLFLSFSPFTFTLLGACLGFSIGRKKRLKNLMWMISLSGFFLIFFLMGKSFQLSPFFAFLFFLLPHPICIYLSQRYVKRLSHGIERA